MRSRSVAPIVVAVLCGLPVLILIAVLDPHTVRKSERLSRSCRDSSFLDSPSQYRYNLRLLDTRVEQEDTLELAWTRVFVLVTGEEGTLAESMRNLLPPSAIWHE